MPRFFRRFAEGVFEVDDLKARTNELAQFIDIAASLIFLHPHYLAVFSSERRFPSRQIWVRNFIELSVFLAGGMRDTVVPHDRTEQLAAILESGQADVSLFWHRGGHELGSDDIDAAKTWLVHTVTKK